MTSRVLKLVAFFSFSFSFALAAAFLFAHPAAAQQVTYYTFDNGPGNYSYSCADPNNNYNETPLPNPLLCLNDYSYGDPNPFFLSVPYPSNLGGGSHYEMVLNPAEPDDGENAWFSVPQPITSGFTSYFAFRITPAPYGSGIGQSPFNADGIAFVIQNAQGGQPADYATGCQEQTYGEDGEPPNSSGPAVVIYPGSPGCIGYSGIDNSLAVEFDTFNDPWDPDYDSDVQSNANHISIQSCGSGVNSSSHDSETGCQIINEAASETPNYGNPTINDNNFGQTLADGNAHEVVVDYTGSQGSPANQLQVYIDPPFVSGTHTPCPSDYYDYAGCPYPGATPAISVTYNIGNHLGPWLGTNNDSLYVGFTASTQSYFEQQELLAWTFTPHTAATQTQPLQPPGPPGTYPTTFPFGNHTFGVNYEQGSYSGIDMVVTAIPISPAEFVSLVTGTSLAGSQCQIYDGTGGNCIVYSVSCVDHGTTTVVPCPSTGDLSQPLIDVKSSFENSIPPTSPGMFQGDPFLAPIASISGDGTTATVTCTGECAVTNGQTVNILGSSDNGYNVTGVTASNSTINSFTFSSSDTNTGTGGYVNSSNLKPLSDFAYNPMRIDGTGTGKTTSWSEIVELSVSPAAPTIISQTSTTFTQGTPSSFPVYTTGNPTPSITLGGDSLSGTGISFTDNGDGTGTLSGTPNATAAAHGTYNLTFTATNSAVPAYGPAAVQYFTLTIGPLQYYLTTSVSPAGAGTVTPSGLYNANTYASLSATANLGYTFSNWTSTTGTVINPNSATGASILMSGPESVTANFTSTRTSQLSVTPNMLAFGNVNLGSSKSMSLSVKNTGSSSLNITNITFTYGPGSGKDYGYTTQCGGPLKAGKSCTIVVTLKAQDLGSGSALLNIYFNQAGSPAVVNLSGTVINPRASLSASNLSFGTVKVEQYSTKAVTLTSSGDTPLLISNIAITGSSDFTQTNTCPGSLAKNTSCTINVKFAPSAKQSRSGTLKITDNASSSPQTVSLSGKGN